MADISGDMQVIVSDEVVKEALQHYFDSHDLPLYIADASIQSVGFMLSVDFKWKQQSRQPKTLADLKQMFPPVDYVHKHKSRIVTPDQANMNTYSNSPSQELAATEALRNQIAQGQVSQESMASIYDMLAKLEQAE